MSLNEGTACAAIMREAFRRAVCLPRYTPRNWWECDVFELTKAGYFREYEVKLTLADFKKDAEKRREVWQPGIRIGQRPEWQNKHELLAKGDPRGPVEFWFVSPAGLIADELLPPWAGLIELADAGPTQRPTYRWRQAVRKRAPRLHEQRADAKTREDIFAACYYRFHDVLRSALDNTEPRTQWSDEAPPEMEALP